MLLKLGKHEYHVKGLFTAFGATLLLISIALDYSYGNFTFLLNSYLISLVFKTPQPN